MNYYNIVSIKMTDNDDVYYDLDDLSNISTLDTDTTLVTELDFKKKGMCKKCQKYASNKNYDDMCSYCYNNILLCQKCNDNFAPKNEQYCSGCKVEVTYSGLDLSVDDILKLPDCKFKGVKMNEKIYEIFDRYCAEKKIKHQFLASENHFKLLLNLCKNQSSGEIFCILDGHRDLPPTVLYAHQADKLLEQIFSENDDKETWRYVHAVARFVFDVWNMKCKDGVFMCYWQDFGELRSCPSSYNKLKDLWNRIQSNYLFQVDNALVDACKVCENDMKLSEQLLRCKYCYKCCHLVCFRTDRCPSCHNIVKINKTSSGVYDSNDYLDVYLYN